MLTITVVLLILVISVRQLRLLRITDILVDVGIGVNQMAAAEQ